MPQAIPAAAAAVAQWVAAAVFSTATGASVATAATLANIAYITAYAVTYVGLSAGVTMGLSAIARAQVPDPEAQKSTRKQTRPPRVVAVGGSSRMSGPFMLRESTRNKLALVIALCEGRLHSIDRIYLNDDRVTVAGGFVQGMANERYGTGDLVRLETRLGEPVETHYGFLTADFGGQWPATSRGDGIASLGLLAQHRSKESFSRHFPNGELVPGVAGTPVCYDWRKDSTAGGVGAQRRNDESTWGPCDNPVVWLVHLEWYRFGRNWDRCIAPVLADLTAEAAVCDELVPLKSGGTEKRYRLAGNYPVNTEPAAVREAILSTMDGWLSVNGKGHLVLKAGRYEAPTFTVTAEHIEGYSWRAFQADEEACNELIVSYVSPDQDFSLIEAGVWRDESDITATGKHRSEDLPLNWVFSRSQAMRLAKRKMTRLNAERRGQVRVGIYGLNGLGERYIRVQNPDLASMADVVCEVTNVEIDFAAGQVVFDVIRADVNIDDWVPAEEEGELPDPVSRPPGDPSDAEPARLLRSPSVLFPLTSTEDTITVETFTGLLPDGTLVVIPAGVIEGLAAGEVYGVFWKEGTGFEAVPMPAQSHMSTGSWILIGWQATAWAGGTEWPTLPPPPPGSGGGGEAPIDTGGSSEVSTLEAALLSGDLKPAEAQTITDQGDLAVLNKTDTAEIEPNAATDQMQVEIAAAQALTGTVEKTVAEVTYESKGGRLVIDARFFMTVWHPSGGDISARIRIVRTPPNGNMYDKTFAAINGDLLQGWQTPGATATLPAGIYTFAVKVTLSNNDAATQTVESMRLTVKEEKR